MKGIILSERIRYVHCEDPEGTHGILVLLGNDEFPTKTFEVNDQADFRRGFRNLKITEDAQSSLSPSQPALVRA